MKNEESKKGNEEKKGDEKQKYKEHKVMDKEDIRAAHSSSVGPSNTQSSHFYLAEKVLASNQVSLQN